MNLQAIGDKGSVCAERTAAPSDGDPAPGGLLQKPFRAAGVRTQAGVGIVSAASCTRLRLLCSEGAAFSRSGTRKPLRHFSVLCRLHLLSFQCCY